MTDSNSAEIIPFPARIPVPAPAAPPVSQRMAGDERLANAMANLNDALVRQAAAMAGWKASLTQLRTVTGQLNDSLRRYNDSLSQLDSKVGALRAQAHNLESWADEALARTPPA